jgi:hypothetical protein
VSPRARGEHLAENRNMTVLLRLVIDPGGHLVHGELIDVDGEPYGRFLSWDRLIELLTARIDSDAG